MRRTKALIVVSVVWLLAFHQVPDKSHQQGSAATGQKPHHDQQPPTDTIATDAQVVAKNGEQQSSRGKEDERNHIYTWLRTLLSSASETKLGDWLLITFNGLLVIVGYLQWRTFRNQADIMVETREVAIAAIGRPYVFVEFVSHNMEEWRSGKKNLLVKFRLTNYGKGPAVIWSIYGYAFLSYSSGKVEPKVPIIKPFPPKDSFHYLMFAEGADVWLDSESRQENDLGGHWNKGAGIILKEGEASPTLETCLARGPLKCDTNQPGWEIDKQIYEHTGIGGPLNPYILGRVYYNDVFGGSHYSTFCFVCVRGGSAMEHAGKPYNERT